MIEGVPEPGFGGDAAIKPVENRLAVGSFRSGRETKEKLWAQAFEQTLVTAGCSVMELINDDDIES